MGNVYKVCWQRKAQAAGKALWRAGAAAKWYWQHHPAQPPQDDRTKLLPFALK